LFDRIDKGLYWDRAWYLVHGCTPVSDGCDNCWAAKASCMRAKQSNPKISQVNSGLTDDGGKFNGNIRFMDRNLGLPIKTKKPTVWAIWNDLFHEDVDYKFISKAICVMASTSGYPYNRNHIYLLLTKRPHILLDYFRWCRENPEQFIPPDIPGLSSNNHIRINMPMSNIWLGTSIEDNESASYRLPALYEAKQNGYAGKIFVSVEPILEQVDLTGWYEHLDWVIVGCETGANRRACNYQWVQNIVDGCVANKVPCFVKQLPVTTDMKHWKISKKIDEFPLFLQRREIPEIGGSR